MAPTQTAGRDVSELALGLVACAAGGVEDIHADFVEPMCRSGWAVGVTLTPTAAVWLQDSGDVERIESTTGLPVRYGPRRPGQARPHPPVGCFVVAPATANTVAKLALGIADNQAVAQVSEALGDDRTPVVIFPRINAAHAQHPAWNHHIATLRDAGVHLIYGEDVWPLHRPRHEPGRQLPWPAIRTAVDEVVRR